MAVPNRSRSAQRQKKEAIWLPVWDARSAAELPVHPPGVFEIGVAMFLLSVAPFAFTLLSVRRAPESISAHLTLASIVARLANVFVPNVREAIRFRGDAPGVIRAVAISLLWMPPSFLLSVKDVRDGWVSGWKALAFGAGVPYALDGGIAVWLAR